LAGSFHFGGGNAKLAVPSISGPFSQAEYETLAEFRYHRARFLRRRKDAARAEGLQAQQYELLLAVSGLTKQQPQPSRNLPRIFAWNITRLSSLPTGLRSKAFCYDAAPPSTSAWFRCR
jgi:hypothetical protein